MTSKMKFIIAYVITCIIALILLVWLIKVEYTKRSMIPETIITFIDTTNTRQFSVYLLACELKKYKVKYPEVAIAQFYKETGFGKDTCSELLYKANNLFGLKNSILRPNASSGLYRIGKQKYAYYHNWRQSVLDYAFYQAHFIRITTTREDWINFINKKYSTDKNYSIEKVIDTYGLNIYR